MSFPNLGHAESSLSLQRTTCTESILTVMGPTRPGFTATVLDLAHVGLSLFSKAVTQIEFATLVCGLL